MWKGSLFGQFYYINGGFGRGFLGNGSKTSEFYYINGAFLEDFEEMDRKCQTFTI